MGGQRLRVRFPVPRITKESLDKKSQEGPDRLKEVMEKISEIIDICTNLNIVRSREGEISLEKLLRKCEEIKKTWKEILQYREAPKIKKEIIYIYIKPIKANLEITDF